MAVIIVDLAICQLCYDSSSFVLGCVATLQVLGVWPCYDSSSFSQHLGDEGFGG